MFTGLIEAVRPVKSVTAKGEGLVLCLGLGELAEDVRLGDSICVNGACLTVSELKGQAGWFEVMAETRRVSTLGKLKVGDGVNLERAMRAEGRFGGHLVQGHVDGVGTVSRIEQSGGQWVMWFKAETQLTDFMIAKGSVAVDGVSLTLVKVQQGFFSVSLIRTTLEETTLGQRQVGDKVNLEADMIGKWVRARLDQILGKGRGAGSVTLDELRKQGFA